MIEFFNGYRKCCLECGCEEFIKTKNNDKSKAMFILICKECGSVIKDNKK